MSARVLVLALDACEVTTARRLIDAGRMPHLARLWSESVRVPTQSPPGGVFVSAAWPTLVFARHPASHRYLCWVTIDPASGEYRHTSPREALGTPFWETLSTAGHRVAVLDVPHAWPADDLNGIQLVEWASHDRHFGLQSSPPELAAEVVEQFGLHPVAGTRHDEIHQFAPCDWMHGEWDGERTHEQARALRDDLVTGIERKRTLSRHYLDREAWDLFVSVVGETHCVGHHFWFLHDPTHERYDPILADEIGDPVGDIYAAADAIIGEHLDAAGPAANVIVLLSHGMRSHHGGNHLLDDVLAGIADGWEHDRSASRSIKVAKGAWRALPLAARRRLHPLVARVVGGRRPGGEPPRLAPRAERPFFAFPNNDVVGAVRLNLAGRDAGGVLDLSARGATIERLKAELLDLVELGAGTPAVVSVLDVEDVYPGTRDDPDFPDLYVEWDLSSPTESIYSPTLGVLRVPYTHVRSGDHDSRGLMLVRAPGLEGDRDLPVTGVENIAPTVAAMLGSELPDVDGRPIAELVQREPHVRSVH